MGRRWLTRKGNYILKSNLPIGVQNMTLKSINEILDNKIWIETSFLWGWRRRRSRRKRRGIKSKSRETTKKRYIFIAMTFFIIEHKVCHVVRYLFESMKIIKGKWFKNFLKDVKIWDKKKVHFSSITFKDSSL